MQYFKDKSSFRDPKGYVLYNNDTVIRAITDKGLEDYKLSKASGFYDDVIKQNKFISFEEVDIKDLDFQGKEQVKLALKSPKLPFISYPYEWTFEQLRKAALLHLDLNLKALNYGLTLCDATAYNIQFIAGEPIFIDILSIEKYQENSPWLAQQQFIDQFLNPLLIWAYACLLYTSPSPRDLSTSRMPSSA